SGANINPAVTFALMLGKRISAFRGVLYVIAQLAGASCGTLVAKQMSPDLFSEAGGGANSPAVGNAQAFGAEVIGTFLLVTTVLMATNAYVGTKISHIPMQLPLAIGFSVFVAHCALIPIDGCSINPARSFGPALVHNFWENQWVFWIGPLTGSAIAILMFEAMFR
ncbi:unnamed protein product, partial [Phaeothamnion confervicola]